MLNKSFTDLFIRKPVIALVVNIVILVIGIVAYTKLNTRQYPRSDSAVSRSTRSAANCRREPRRQRSTSRPQTASSPPLT
jgi:CBS-domain-containing membrane protein